MKLSQAEMKEAVAEGVRRGIVELGTRFGYFDRSDELFYNAIKEGVAAAIFKVATNATDMPSADFYDAIEEGAAKGFAAVKVG